MKTILAFILSLLSASCVMGQTYDTNGAFVQTFAGSGFTGYVDGVGTQTMFSNPNSIVADSAGTLFVMDYGNARIRKITPDGTVTTFAGGGPGTAPGFGTNVSLGSSPYSDLIIDHTNTIWFVSANGLTRCDSNGYVSRPAQSFTGLGTSSGLCFDSKNNLYYSYSSGNKIFRWNTNGTVEVFAGSGNFGTVDGNGVFTSFAAPNTLAADAADNIYVVDQAGLIRRINQNQDVVTIAGRHNINADGQGTNTGFGSGIGYMAGDNSGNFFITANTCLRKMDAQTNVTTVAGSFSQNGYTNGVAGNLARFNGLSGVCIVSNALFVTDANNQRIRVINFNPQTVPVSPANLSLSTYAGLRITGVVGRTYQIQSSPDLNSWIDRQKLFLTSSPYLWIDSSPVNGSGYYRALLLP
jgi:sugar lactone lactonase YvrE